jgi:hypothetical protein
MLGKSQWIVLFAVLLGGILLAAQFHSCADLTGALPGSHICPLCSTAGSILPTQPPSLVFVPVTRRLEVVAMLLAVSAELPSTLSARAPPSR